MKHLTCSLTLGAIVLILGIGIVSAQQPMPFMAYGPTKTSCGSFTASSGQQREVYEWWVLGFVSGAGLILNSQNLPMATTDPGGITAAVGKHCTNNPLDPLLSATISVVNQLREKAK